MRRIVLIILLLVFSATVVFSQKDSTAGDSRFSVSLGPALLPIRSMNFGVSTGAEFRFSEKISFFTELSFFPGPKNNADSTGMHKKYLRIKPEIRYYLPAGINRPKMYVALQYSHASRSFDNERGGYYFLKGRTDSVNNYDRIHIKSPVQTIAGQLGVLFRAADILSIDYFMGFGFRWVNTSYSQAENLHLASYSPIKGAFHFNGAYQYEGLRTGVHLTMGIRLICRIGKAQDR